MPNLPTSLILVLLAVAWLWVLVPMFARSREAVPETDDGAAGFRVLRRAGARLRRPAFRRHRSSDEGEDDFVDDDTELNGTELAYTDLDDSDLDDENDAADGDLVESLVDDDFDDDLEDSYDDSNGDDISVAVDDDRADRGAGDRVLVARAGVARPDPDHHYDDHDYDAADEWQASHHEVAAPSRVRTGPAGEPRRDRSRPPAADGSPPAAEYDSRSADRPVTHRPGRGGFDPEHDAASAAFRYRRRRLVTLLLVLVTGGLIAGGVLGINDKLWIGATVAGLVLVGYLTYLSRQVRIEREISERRRARMQRARAIRPAPHREAEAVSPYRSEPRRAVSAGPHRSRPADPRTGPVQQPAARSAQLPPLHRRVGTVVDFDDDDPAFDDLDHYEPVVYRRAAGQ